MKKRLLLLLISICFTHTIYCQNNIYNKNQIQPWKKNPRYWQFKNKPIMLLGGSNDDNLFQWTKDILIPHLDSMKQIGANYVRNTMSDRKDKNFEIYPYKQLGNGKYDLNQWNDDYWKRFDFFLQETAKRNIIVQIEVWDRFDFSQKHWITHPYNPKNNINYTRENSGLVEEYPEHPGRNKQPFFFSTPNQRNNKIILEYQERFVETLLNYSLKYNHVLYCIDNETSGEEEWGCYWSTFISDKAKLKGKNVYITEMWDNWDIKSEHHKRTFDHPERYQFCDVSQNNHQREDVHWNNFQWVRKYISNHPIPINTVKTYGSDIGKYGFGTTKDGIERWWQHLLGGAAAVRFHRPEAGLGLSQPSISSIKAARKLESVIKFWDIEPNNNLLQNRFENRAYASYLPGKIYIVFTPNGGDIQILLNQKLTKYKIRYLNIRTGEWDNKRKQVKKAAKTMQVKTPDNNAWITIIEKK